MQLIDKFKKSNSLRWFFFSVGLVAVVALTGMNVYSLYALRESTIESAKENRKNQLDEFAEQVKHRFYRPFWNMIKLDMEHVEKTWQASGNFPDNFKDVLSDAMNDPLFSEIYYIAQNADGCQDPGKPLYKYNPGLDLFTISDKVPETVCDGFGISKSSIKVMLNDNYRWNNNVTFDAHRSMTLALINLTDKSVVGHLNFIIDQNYLVEGFLRPEIDSQFGIASESGLVVWLRDWLRNEIIATNDETYPFIRDNIDLRQRFPDLLDNWVLHASFIESPTIAASDASLNRNLIVLGIAVLALFGALMFMFINAQRERELAQRQAGFLANITHELKTPLAVMQAAGENIADGRVTEGDRLKNYGDHIYNEAVRLRKMIEKLLDVAKVDSGQTMAEASPVYIQNIVEEFYIANKDFIQNKGFEFTCSANNTLPLVMIDPDHLETILNNLIENAIKYSSKEKKIHIAVKLVDQNIAVSVKDCGDGIPKKSQKLIFDKFYRVENTLTAKTKGHGLGLAIVKNMVEINGGTITVNSQPGKGSTFTVAFPVFITNTNTEEEKKYNSDASPLQPKTTVETN